MKIKKPEIVPMFKCSTGPPVETLDLWKSAELEALLKDRVPPNEAATLAAFLLEHAEEFVAILWLKEKGRPNGAKDKKPRKPRAAAEGDAA